LNINFPAKKKKSGKGGRGKENGVSLKVKTTPREPDKGGEKGAPLHPSPPPGSPAKGRREKKREGKKKPSGPLAPFQATGRRQYTAGGKWGGRERDNNQHLGGINDKNINSSA